MEPLCLREFSAEIGETAATASSIPLPFQTIFDKCSTVIGADKDLPSVVFIASIYLDGKQDETLIKASKNDKWHTDTAIEDHYALVAEPGGDYITQVTPISGKSTDIANSILTTIRQIASTNTIRAIGCDSTNTNTGCKAGVIRHLEIAFGHPVNWFICMLHVNELPLRHLFLHLDG